MPGYAENVGIASFLQELSRNLMTQSAEEQRRRDEENKIAAEQVRDSIRRGEIMHRQEAPLQPTTGQPLGIGSFVDTGSMLGVSAGLPTPNTQSVMALPQQPTQLPAQQFSMPKNEPLTIEQQIALPRSTLRGQQISDEYVTVPQERPSGAPTKTTIADGKKTEEWGSTGMTEYQRAQLEIQQKRANSMAARYGNSGDFFTAYNAARRTLDSDINAMDWTADQRSEWINNKTEELMEQKSRGGKAKPTTPPPVTPPAKRKWNPVK